MKKIKTSMSISVGERLRIIDLETKNSLILAILVFTKIQSWLWWLFPKLTQSPNSNVNILKTNTFSSRIYNQIWLYALISNQSNRKITTFLKKKNYFNNYRQKGDILKPSRFSRTFKLMSQINQCTHIIFIAIAEMGYSIGLGHCFYHGFFNAFNRLFFVGF